jgi:predicted DNA-binding protein YlxM (UPF0122 family)
MLTEKQHTYLKLHFQEDYSLSEMAEQFSISRQAVNDHIKRAIDQLETYESQLLLIKKYHQRIEHMRKFDELLKQWIPTSVEHAQLQKELAAILTQMENEE